MAESAKSAAPDRQVLPLARSNAPVVPRPAQIHLHAPSAAADLSYANSRKPKPADVSAPPLRRNAACLENQTNANCEVN